MHATPIHLPRANTSIHSVSRSPFSKGTAKSLSRGLISAVIRNLPINAPPA